MLSLVAAIVANAATPMLGTNVATVERMYQFVKSKNSSFDREIAEQFIAVSTIYGMRGDIALCQSIIETGWFKYTGGTAVTPDDHNYCGLGVTTLGQKGCQFSTVKEGVTAQIQHLYAYCCTKSIPAGETLVDPRFNYVTRGCAPNWEDLGSGKWAAAAGYGTAIIAMYNDMMAFNVQGDTPSTGNASLTASTTSVSLSGTQGGTAPSTSVTITGANLTSDIAYSSSSSAFTVSTSNWNSRTGGTLKITLNTALTAGTYSGYIAVQSGTTRIQINCTGTISTGTTPSPGTASLKASTTSLSFTAAKGATAPSSSVTITGANLTSDIAYNSSSSAFKVSTSNWNSRTGGTLNISLDTSKSVGTYSGYIAVQSGDQRVEINCTGTITEATQPEQPTPGTPSLKASSTSVSFTAEKGATAPSKTITITGANLTSDIAYNSSSSAFKVSTSNWNSRTGGSMTITLDTSKSAGNYSVHLSPLLSLFTGLTGLAANILIRVLNTLTMIGLGGSLASDYRCDLSNRLLVVTLNNDSIGVRNLEGDSFGLGDEELLLRHTVYKRVTKEELKGLALLCYLVTNTNNLKGLGITVGNALYHVRDKRTGKAMKALVFLLLGMTGNNDLVVLLSDGELSAQLLSKGSERSLYGNDVSISNGHGNVCGDSDRHSTNSRHILLPPLNYQTNARTSPPTLRLRAFLSVMIPLEVETTAMPRPFITLGISS